MTPNLPMVIVNKPSISLISKYGSPEHILNVQQSMLDFLALGLTVIPLEEARSDVLFTILTEKMENIKTLREQYENSHKRSHEVSQHSAIPDFRKRSKDKDH